MAMRSKTIAVLVVAMLLTSSLAAQSPLWAQSHQRPSGCHGSGSKAPRSGHDCCLMGHDVALLQTSRLSRPAIHYAGSDDLVVSPPIVVANLDVQCTSSIRFLDHPGTPSLRI